MMGDDEKGECIYVEYLCLHSRTHNFIVWFEAEAASTFAPFVCGCSHRQPPRKRQLRCKQGKDISTCVRQYRHVMSIYYKVVCAVQLGFNIARLLTCARSKM